MLNFSYIKRTVLVCSLIALVFILVAREVWDLRVITNQKVRTSARQALPVAIDVREIQLTLNSVQEYVSTYKKTIESSGYAQYRQYFKETQEAFRGLQEKIKAALRAEQITEQDYNKLREQLTAIIQYTESVKQVIRNKKSQSLLSSQSHKLVIPLVAKVNSLISDALSKMSNPIKAETITKDSVTVNRKIYNTRQVSKLHMHWARMVNHSMKYLVYRDLNILLALKKEQHSIEKIIVELLKSESKLSAEIKRIVGSLRTSINSFMAITTELITAYKKKQAESIPANNISQLTLLLAEYNKKVTSFNIMPNRAFLNTLGSMTHRHELNAIPAIKLDTRGQEHRQKLGTIGSSVSPLLVKMTKQLSNLDKTFGLKSSRSNAELINRSATKAISRLENNVQTILVKLSVYAIVVVGLVMWLLMSLLSKIKKIKYTIDKTSKQNNLEAICLDTRGDNEVSQLAATISSYYDAENSELELIYESSSALKTEVRRWTETSNKEVNHQKQKDHADKIEAMIAGVNVGISQLTQPSDEAAKYVKKISRQSAECLQVVEGFISGSNELVSVVDNVSVQLQDLAKVSKNIEDVLSVIKGISEQTNLLALNAAIEAARAGEQGRGFAVVADEVRTLSLRTQSEAGKIEKAIGSLCSRVSKTVVAMKTGADKAANSVDTAKETGKLLQNIQSQCSASHGACTQISAVTAEQKGQTNMLLSAIGELQQMLEESVNDTVNTVAFRQALFEKVSELTGVIQHTVKKSA